MDKPKQRLPEALPVFLIAISVLAFFGQFMCSGESLFGSDFVLYFCPLKDFIRDHVYNYGAIPLWNPYQLSGTPLITNIQASVFYPLDFLFYMVPAKYAYGYTVIVHYIFASVFMYVFARSLSINKTGALLSAVIFTYNGFLMAHLYAGHLTLVHSYVWIPLVFFYVHKFLNTPHPKHVILAGLFLGIQILGGFPQIAFYTILGALLYAFYCICFRTRREHGQYIARAALGVGMIVGIGFCLAALQLLPTFEFMQLSTRAGGTSYEFATLNSFPPKHFITLLLPDLYGIPANKTFWISDSSWIFWEYSGYVGICGLVLTVVAIKRIMEDRVGRFFLLLMIVSLFLCLGKYNPFYRIIYYLPGFHHFRIPAQILFLYVFAIAVLAGMALNHLTGEMAFSGIPRMVVLAGLLFLLILAVWIQLHPYSFFYIVFKFAKPVGLTSDQIGNVHIVVRNAVWRGSAILLVIVMVLSLYRKGLPSRATTGGLLVLISMVDIGSFAFPLIRTVNLDSPTNQWHLIRQLKMDRDIYRATVNNGCFSENAGLRYQFQDIQGYDPLILKRYVQYVNKSQGIPPDDKVVNMHYIRSMDNPLINMLNLKYTIDCDSKKIMKRRGFVARAYIVHQAVVKDEQEILDYMMGPDFEYRKMAVFGRETNIQEIAVAEDGGDDEEMCRILSYATDEITVEAKLNRPGYLVMSEINYPGWRAYVNGREKDILTANFLFRSVSIEPGRYSVRFVFRPFSFKVGTVVSLFSMVFVIASLLVFTRRGKR
jgi:hypothetical protein